MADKISNGKIYLVISLLFIVIIGGGAFYWYEFRPAKIRHDCSWVRKVNPAEPALPAITKEDVEKGKQEYLECLKTEADKATLSESLDNYIKTGSVNTPKEENTAWDKLNNDSHNYFVGLFCDRSLKQERPAISAKPEQAWYKEANKNEYDFCIHEKGL